MNRRESRFTRIYEKNIWHGAESLSGKGSDTTQTDVLKRRLVEFINNLGIKTLIDAPCGDCNWIQSIISDMNIEKYIGIDIVGQLIKENQTQFLTNTKMSFLHNDIVTDSLPDGDLLLCRDCLVHLSNEDIKSFLQNFCNSNISYLLTTTFTKLRDLNNYSSNELHLWRPLVLWREPVLLSRSKTLIMEECTEIDAQDNESYLDKALGLWTQKQIKEDICGI
jgi:hypothetical protein